MKQQYGAIIEYVDHSYVERHRRPRLADRSGEKSSSRQQKRRLSESEERESGVEEGEVDSDEDDDTEMEIVRAARVGRQYDWSSLSALSGSAVSRVLVASSLPESAADDSTLIRYAFAPFVPVQWVHIGRLRTNGQLVALVALQSLSDSQSVMAKAGQIHIAHAPLTLHYARKATRSQPQRIAAAELTPAAAAAVAAVPAPSASPIRPAHVPASFAWHDSGYWVDAATGLMYHAASGLYYDATRQHYLAYDPVSQHYVVVPSQQQQRGQPPRQESSVFAEAAASAALPSTAAATAQLDTAAGHTEAAAAVAVTVSSQTSVGPIRFGLKLPLSASASPAATKQAKAAIFAVQPASHSSNQRSAQQPFQPPPQVGAPPTDDNLSGLPSAEPSTASSLSIAAAGVDVPLILRSAWFDLSRLACLLCQRGFVSVEQLTRHVEASALHSRNVQQLTLSQAQQ